MGSAQFPLPTKYPDIFHIINVLIIRPLIKPSGKLLCIHCINKSVRIDLPDLFGDRLDFIPSHNGVEHIAFLLSVASDSLKKRSIMVCIFPDLLIDFIRLGGDNEQRLFLVTFVQRMQDLSGCKLENNRIQRFVPSKQITCDQEDNTVSGKNVVPGFNAVFFGKKDGDKIGAAAGGVGIQTE